MPRSGREDPASGALRAAREVARAASHLAYEAATLAQLFDGHETHRASLEAAQASIQSAKRVFQLEDEEAAHPREGADALLDALRLSRDAIDEAAEAIASARAAVDAAISFHARSTMGGGEPVGGA